MALPMRGCRNKEFKSIQSHIACNKSDKEKKVTQGKQGTNRKSTIQCTNESIERSQK